MAGDCETLVCCVFYKFCASNYQFKSSVENYAVLSKFYKKMDPLYDYLISLRKKTLEISETTPKTDDRLKKGKTITSVYVARADKLRCFS